MTDNVTLYLASSQPVTQALLKQITESIDTPTISEDGTSFDIKWEKGWHIRLNTMPADALPNHLNGLLGFAQQLGATPKILARMKQTKQAVAMIIEPGFESFGYARSLALGITQALNGFFFAVQGFYSKNNKLVVGAPGMPRMFFPELIIETPLSLARKSRSIEQLKQQNIPYIDHLPVIVDEEAVTLRERDEVAVRAMALCMIAGLAMDLERSVFNMSVKRYGLQGAFTPLEMLYIRNKQPAEDDDIRFSWRIEAYATLLWTLSYLDVLPAPNTAIDVMQVSEVMRIRTRDEFIQQATLRPAKDILDVLDLHYRYMWAVQELRMKEQAMPDSLHPGIVFERCHALNWLVRSQDADWDDVQVHT